MFRYAAFSIRAINGKEPGEIPSCFSLHFSEECGEGDAGVEAHLKFVKETDTDICKIMNENLIPYCEGISCGGDYKKLPSFDLESEFMKKQIELTKRLLDACGPVYDRNSSWRSLMRNPSDERTYGYDGSRLAMTEHFRQDRDTVLDM